MTPSRGSSALGAAAVIVVAAAMLTLAPSTPAHGGERERDRECAQSETGNTPLIDLGADEYMGAQGGLYPLGSNEIPSAHLALGLEKAADVVPRDAAGEPDPTGIVGLASIGISNTARAYPVFEEVLAANGAVDGTLVTVNGAQGGQDLSQWADPTSQAWEGLDAALAESGVTPEQVQAIWLMVADRIDGSPPPFPDHANTYADKLTSVLQLLQDEMPNLQVAYLTSREYGGYNDVSSPSPEPTAYEEGFGVKWTIERQLNGEAALNTDPDAGAVEAPWVAWGPYVWADGARARSDGLTWECNDFRGDGVHPAERGNDKWAEALMGFFTAEPTAAWMFSDRELPPPPAVIEPAAPPSTIAGGGVATDTTVATDATAPPGRDQPGDTRPPTDDPTATTGGGGETTRPPDAAAGRSDSGDIPPLVWILIGAGGALAVAAGTVWMLRRRGESPGSPDG